MAAKPKTSNQRMKAKGQTQMQFWIPQKDADLIRKAADSQGGVSVAAFLRIHATEAAKTTLAKTGS